MTSRPYKVIDLLSEEVLSSHSTLKNALNAADKLMSKYPNMAVDVFIKDDAGENYVVAPFG